MYAQHQYSQESKYGSIVVIYILTIFTSTLLSQSLIQYYKNVTSLIGLQGDLQSTRLEDSHELQKESRELVKRRQVEKSNDWSTVLPLRQESPRKGLLRSKL